LFSGFYDTFVVLFVTIDWKVIRRLDSKLNLFTIIIALMG